MLVLMAEELPHAGFVEWVEWGDWNSCLPKRLLVASAEGGDM